MNTVEMAFQEAGHVVMTLLWGVWRVDKVSIVGRGNSGGSIEYSPVTEMEGEELSQRFGTRVFDAKLERMMGAPVALAIQSGSEVVYQGDTGDSDFNCVVRVIQDDIPGGSLADAWVVILEHEPKVQADLKRMWPVVEALSQELIAKQELCDYEIRSIVRGAVNRLSENERTWAISRLRNTSPC